MKTKSKRPSAPAQRSRGQQRARARLLHPRAGRRCTPRSRAPPMPRRRRRPFYSMGFARSAWALDIICAAREASGSGVWRRLTRGRAQACVAWRRRAGAGREYRGAPGSARCLRSVPRQERLVSLFTFRAPHRGGARSGGCGGRLGGLGWSGCWDALFFGKPVARKCALGSWEGARATFVQG